MSLNPRITDWHGRHVWLVGASTGIGRATASRLHQLGAKVTVSARSPAALDRFVTEHPGAQGLALDATDAAAVQQAADALRQRHGRLDLVMYCAGHYQAMPALISPETAAQAIVHGWAGGKFEIHFPKRFTRFLKALRTLPDGLYFSAMRLAVRA